MPDKKAVFNLGEDVEPLSKEVKAPPSEALSLALTFTESYYQVNKGKLPTPDDFEFLKIHLKKSEIEPLLKSDEFREGLAKRGIFWPKNYDGTNARALSVLSPQQQHAVLIVTDPTRNESLRKRLELVGIQYNTWRNWMKQPAFANAVTVLSEDVLTDNVAAVHTSMTAKAMNGDVTAARLVYELSGRHDPGKQQMVDLARIIGLVLESLTRHVTDTAILDKLGRDFDRILAGDVPAIESAKPDFTFVEQIVDAVVEEDSPEEAIINGALNDLDVLREEVKRDDSNVPKGFFDV